MSHIKSSDSSENSALRFMICRESCKLLRLIKKGHPSNKCEYCVVLESGFGENCNPASTRIRFSKYQAIKLFR